MLQRRDGRQQRRTKGSVASHSSSLTRLSKSAGGTSSLGGALQRRAHHTARASGSSLVSVEDVYSGSLPAGPGALAPVPPISPNALAPELTPPARTAVPEDSRSQPLLDGPRHAPRSAGSARIGVSAGAGAPEQAEESEVVPQTSIQSSPAENAAVEQAEEPASEEQVATEEVSSAGAGEVPAAGAGEAPATAEDEAPAAAEVDEAASTPAATNSGSAKPTTVEELPVDDASVPAVSASIAEGEAD